jgi:hypothetical protein
MAVLRPPGHYDPQGQSSPHVRRQGHITERPASDPASPAGGLAPPPPAPSTPLQSPCGRPSSVRPHPPKHVPGASMAVPLPSSLMASAVVRGHAGGRDTAGGGTGRCLPLEKLSLAGCREPAAAATSRLPTWPGLVVLGGAWERRLRSRADLACPRLDGEQVDRREANAGWGYRRAQRRPEAGGSGDGPSMGWAVDTPKPAPRLPRVWEDRCVRPGWGTGRDS